MLIDLEAGATSDLLERHRGRTGIGAIGNDWPHPTFSPDGSRVLLVTSEGIVAVWDTATRKLIRQWGEVEINATAALLGPQGNVSSWRAGSLWRGSAMSRQASSSPHFSHSEKGYSPSTRISTWRASRPPASAWP